MRLTKREGRSFNLSEIELEAKTSFNRVTDSPEEI